MKSNVLSRFFIFLYSIAILGLFFYSYTQVDLSLTLSRISVWQSIEKSFQYIGYFQRPLSSGLFIILICLLFISYIGFLKKTYFSRKTLWILIIATAILLTFSYNAFSYDLFNYIFDAKIVTHYFQNPYIHKALDYSQDPMLSFMHWTQRTYPYGPIWLLITIPISFLGLQFFLPTFFLFKAIQSISYLGTAYFLEKILKKTNPDKALFGLSLFAFSPLVIVEGLISSHNDMIMVFFATASLFFLLQKKNTVSFLLLFLSIGIKFATAMLLPLWILALAFKKYVNSYEKLFFLGFLFLIIPIILASIRTNFQPWYLLFLFPFPSLMPKQKEILAGFTLFSFASLFQYVPFLYVGNWDNPIPSLLSIMLWGSLGISILIALALFAKKSE